VGYVWNNFWLRIGQFGISSGPAGVPYPSVWNGSLWSLYWEFLCYLGIALLGVVGVITGKRLAVVGLATLIWLVSIVTTSDSAALVAGSDQGITVVLRLSFMFLVGSSLYLFRESVPLNPALGFIAVGVFAGALVFVANYRIVGGVALVYVLLWLSVALPFRIGAKNDISYGVYIYAFPVQQLLAIAGYSQIGWFGYAMVSLATTIPLAWASWLAVERPLLRLKNWTPGWLALPRVQRILAARWMPLSLMGVLTFAYALQAVAWLETG